MACVYTPKNFSIGVRKCSDTGVLKFNEVDLETCWTNLHLHPVEEDSLEMAVSPNNAAVVLTLGLPATSFYVLSANFTKDEEGTHLKLLLSHHTVIFDSELPVADELSKMMIVEKFLAS